jgi:hypothetical protein
VTWIATNITDHQYPNTNSAKEIYRSALVSKIIECNRQSFCTYEIKTIQL